MSFWDKITNWFKVKDKAAYKRNEKRFDQEINNFIGFIKFSEPLMIMIAAFLAILGFTWNLNVPTGLETVSIMTKTWVTTLIGFSLFFITLVSFYKKEYKENFFILFFLGLIITISLGFFMWTTQILQPQDTNGAKYFNWIFYAIPLFFAGLGFWKLFHKLERVT